MYEHNGALYIGREVEIQALGRTWKVSRWDRIIWDDFAIWARTKLPDPVAEMTKHIDKLALKDAVIMRELIRLDEEEKEKHGNKAILMAPRQVQQLADHMAERAQDKSCSYLSFNSPEMNSILNSVIGETHIFWLLLRKYHPDITEDDAYEVKLDIGQEELQRVLKIVAGATPRGVSAEKNAPVPAA